MNEIIERLRVVIRDALRSKRDLDISIHTPLNEVVTSSLQFVVIVGEIERVFGVMLPDEALDPENLRDLATIARLLERLLAKAG